MAGTGGQRQSCDRERKSHRWSASFACSGGFVLVCILLIIGPEVSSRPLPKADNGIKVPEVDIGPSYQDIIGFILERRRRSGGEWSYEKSVKSSNGVKKWDQLFHSCAGRYQSPVDLLSSNTTYDPSLKPFVFKNFDSVQSVDWSIVNNGHTVQAEVTKGKLQVVGGSLHVPYQVAQCQWNWGGNNSRGSAHTVNGKAYPMELHIVCYNTNYRDLITAVGNPAGLAVLGFFYEISNENQNSAMQTIIDVLPSVQIAGTRSNSVQKFALKDLMASTDKYYRYRGSLTTPTCNEVVTWTVFADTIPISQTQLNEFRKLQDSNSHSMVDNYRPVQSLNGRALRASFDDSDFQKSATNVISIQVQSRASSNANGNTNAQKPSYGGVIVNSGTGEDEQMMDSVDTKTVQEEMCICK